MTEFPLEPIEKASPQELRALQLDPAVRERHRVEGDVIDDDPDQLLLQLLHRRQVALQDHAVRLRRGHLALGPLQVKHAGGEGADRGVARAVAPRCEPPAETWPWEFDAKEKAQSARAKMTPPWQVPMKFRYVLTRAIGVLLRVTSAS